MFRFPERHFLADTVLGELTFGWYAHALDTLEGTVSILGRLDLIESNHFIVLSVI